MKEIVFKYEFILQEYVYELPVYKYRNRPIVICKLGIKLDTFEVQYNVYDTNDNSYTAYYDREYSKKNKGEVQIWKIIK